MAAVDDLDELIEQSRLALGEILKGIPEPVKKLCSHREDVTHASPHGPPVRGWEHVASTRRDGEFVDSEIVSGGGPLLRVAYARRQQLIRGLGRFAAFPVRGLCLSITAHCNDVEPQRRIGV